jgi:hypothetical protein
MEKLTKMEVLENLSKEFGNDQELGKKYREFVKASEGKLWNGKSYNNLTKNNPNDFDLGKELRKEINELRELDELEKKIRKS